MSDNASKLILGLAAAVGVALVAFARKYGADVELPELPPGTEPIARAELELERWRGMKETDVLAAPLLARYWAAVGSPPQPPVVPWSAAFISFVAGKSLKPSANHVGYARAALEARQRQQLGKYWAFAPNESGVLPVRRGDILLRGRGVPVGWQDVERDTGHKDAHGDIVIDTTGGLLSLIGGNVSNGVTLTQQPYSQAAPLVFAVLRPAPSVPMAGGIA